MSSSQQTVLVTGVTRGIGAEMLAQLRARKDTRIIAGVRNLEAPAAKNLIAQADKNLIVVKLDSESDTDAKDAAKKVQEEYGVDHVDLVIAIAGILTVAVVAVVFGTHAVAFVTGAYPADGLQAAALDRCAAGNRDFLRFSERQRAACYARVHLVESAER